MGSLSKQLPALLEAHLSWHTNTHTHTQSTCVAYSSSWVTSLLAALGFHLTTAIRIAVIIISLMCTYYCWLATSYRAVPRPQAVTFWRDLSVSNTSQGVRTGPRPAPTNGATSYVAGRKVNALFQIYRRTGNVIMTKSITNIDSQSGRSSEVRFVAL